MVGWLDRLDEGGSKFLQRRGHGPLGVVASTFGRNVAVGLATLFIASVVERIASSPSMLLAYPRDVWDAMLAAAAVTAFWAPFIVPTLLVYTGLTHRSESRRGAWAWWPLLLAAFLGPIRVVGADPELMPPLTVLSFVVPAVVVTATTRIGGDWAS